MKTYELTYIASPTANQEELETLQKEVETLIQSKEGAVLKLERTAAKTLSYPIKNQISGYFTTVTFQLSEENLKEIDNKVKQQDKILRHFIVVKKPVKEMKARIIRRNAFKPGSLTGSHPREEKKSIFSGIFKKGSETEEKIEVKEEEINKKLDEILSE